MTKINKIVYGEKAKLVICINDHKGGDAEIVLKKTNNKEFESGKKEIKYKASVSGSDVEQVIQIEENWEELKEKDKNDKLEATVKYEGKSKKAGALEILAKPQVVVDYRRTSGYKGDFGFDWFRVKDTAYAFDNKFEDIISKQYETSSHTKLQKNGNKYGSSACYKKNAALLTKLKKEYKKFNFSWTKTVGGKKTPDDYLIPWLSLYKDAEAELELQIEVFEEADYLEFVDNPNFEITPPKIDISGKKGKVKPHSKIKIKCVKEFSSDQTLTMNAVLKSPATGKLHEIEAGKISVWSNEAAKQKTKKVLFVQVLTPPVSKAVELVPNATPEKDRVNNYIKQALIQLHKDSVIIDLDLTDTSKGIGKHFKDKYILSKKVNYSHTTGKNYIHTWLAAQLDAKYKSFFKAFYFAEPGTSNGKGGLNGYAHGDHVVLFSTANNQTASHEFLHTFNLPHTFTNSETDANAEFTYEYAKTENLLDYSHHVDKNGRNCLYYWQWEKANSSV